MACTGSTVVEATTTPGAASEEDGDKPAYVSLMERISSGVDVLSGTTRDGDGEGWVDVKAGGVALADAGELVGGGGGGPRGRGSSTPGTGRDTTEGEEEKEGEVVAHSIGAACLCRCCTRFF